MSNENFDFNNFIQESKDSIQKPGEYFLTMKTEGGLGEPVIKALIYGAIAGVFALLWGLLKVGAVTGGLFGGAVGFMALIGSVIGAVIGVFIGAIIILVISAICSGNTDFEPNLRVSAALMVLMPVAAFLSFTSAIHPVLGAIFSLAINLYGLWLLYNDLIHTLKAKESTARIVSYVLAAIMVIFLLVGLRAKKSVEDYMGKDYMELMEKRTDKLE